MKRQVLLGDDAVALGALHAGLSGAYGYPGTPSTEIFEYIQRHRPKNEDGTSNVFANWAANEKVGYEEAMGMSYAGLRTIVTMKHVGLNVAADPFMNSAITGVNGGFLLAVADDPSMHSSQNEQDSRYFADFAKLPCLEPATQQEAYDMAREAFDYSERVKLPVVMRLVTRLAHSRADVQVGDQRDQNDYAPSGDKRRWTLLPVNARIGYRELLDKQKELEEYAENAPWNVLHLGDKKLGVIATGIAYNYFMEALGDQEPPSYLKLGVYPIPREKVRKLVEHCDEILVLEDGYAYVERHLQGLLGLEGTKITGRLDGTLPRAGELSPAIVRKALTGDAPAGEPTFLKVPPRPPALCKGCPHGDTYDALNVSREKFDDPGTVFADIGCYTLGAYPPYEAIQSCLDMGASVSMAAGAADAGVHPSVAVIGDSTFIHSGMTPLIGAVRRNCPMTVVIVDNATVGMTGQQETMATGEDLDRVIAGLGVEPDHVRVVKPHPRQHENLVQVFDEELAYEGTSVIIARRPCIQMRKR